MRVGRRNRWVARGVVSAVCVGLLLAFAAIERTTPLIVPMVLLVTATVCLAGLVVDSAGAAPADWTAPIDFLPASSGQDGGLASHVRLIENHLSSRQQDPLMAGRLRRMTDDRLARIGLSPGDPGVADRLGPTLVAVIEGPPRNLTLTEIDECIRRIEELTA